MHSILYTIVCVTFNDNKCKCLTVYIQLVNNFKIVVCYMEVKRLYMYLLYTCIGSFLYSHIQCRSDDFVDFMHHIYMFDN